MSDLNNDTPTLLSTKKRIGKAIAARRKELGIEQENLLSLSSVSAGALSSIENGKGNPTLNTLEKILDVLGMELNVGIKRIRS